MMAGVRSFCTVVNDSYFLPNTNYSVFNSHSIHPKAQTVTIQLGWIRSDTGGDLVMKYTLFLAMINRIALPDHLRREAFDLCQLSHFW